MKKTTPKKPTSLDFAILGLVSHQPLSGYGIRKIFETTEMGNFGTSPGTIYPALKRMQKLMLVENLTSKTDNKNKFHITIKGKELLQNWLVRPLEMIDVSRKREEIILRFAFMDKYSSQKQKLVFLESFHDLLTIYIKQLLDYHKAENLQMPLHGRLSFEHGIESYKATLKWCKKTLLVIKKMT
tara:strand:+ start:937 stop:1488 length:552 start_codon:yes stop_codon:yes gene_type:complete